MDVSVIDRLFQRIDRDASGEIDVHELKTALRAMQAEMATAAKAGTAAESRTLAIRGRMERARAVYEQTVEAETAVVDKGIATTKTTFAQLGEQLRRKGMKVCAHRNSTRVRAHTSAGTHKAHRRRMMDPSLSSSPPCHDYHTMPDAMTTTHAHMTDTHTHRRTRS